MTDIDWINKYHQLCLETRQDIYPIKYDLSERAFFRAGCNTEMDLIRLVAFTYSWMPTIIRLGSKYDDERSIRKALKQSVRSISSLKAAKKNTLNSVTRESIETLGKLVPSLVAISKIFYFVQPLYLPIVDRHVVNGWKKLFRKDGLALCNAPKQINLKNRSINAYLEYAECMRRWVMVCRQAGQKTSLRKLEIRLYLFGKNTVRN